ncbi:MAG TPA: hypothetical protein ENK75_04460, partial [Saprospiraceae bacterium]|nr:hypothetical protein [Saprospiraceae bacterium]
MSKFENLLVQIELFIRKYYKNEMLKGALLFAIIFLFSFLLVSVLEYFGRFNQTARFVLFYSFIAVNLGVLIKFIIIPLLKLNKLSNRLSFNQASKMIGSIFPSISDKLQNTLQLNAQLNNQSQNIDLIQASINQRASTLSVVPFTTGIQLSENKKYLKYLLPILLIIILLFSFKPALLSESSKRIINYNQTCIPQAPFEFNLVSPSTIKEGDSYTLQIKLTGDEIPQEVKIKSNLGTYNLKKESNVLFTYTFANVKENLIFTCQSNEFTSQQFTVDVLKKPIIEDITLQLNYPKHTGLANEKLNNIGDVSVPEGTTIEWNLSGKNTTKLKVIFADTNFTIKPDLSNHFKFNHQLFNSI